MISNLPCQIHRDTLVEIWTRTSFITKAGETVSRLEAFACQLRTIMDLDESIATRLLKAVVPKRLRAAIRAGRSGRRGQGAVRLPERLDEPPGSRILVLAPHPDDEAIGCGGTLRRYQEMQVQSLVVFMTDGEQGNSFCDLTGSDLVARRRAEAAAAAALLGVQECRFLSMPDGRLDCNRTSVGKVHAEIERVKPDVLFVPSPLEHHRDHTTTFWIAVKVLARYASPIEVFVYEVWAPVRANCVVPIDFGPKAQAIRAYASQLDKHELYVRASAGLGRYRAVTALLDSNGHAECFWRGSRDSFLRFANLTRRSELGLRP